MTYDLAEIRMRLLAYSMIIKTEELFPALEVGASAFVLQNPFAFCLSTCLDRGMKAEITMTIPYWMNLILGHLDAKKINQMTIDDVSAVVNRLPRRPRYVNAAPRTIKEISHLVAEKYNGDASLIWKGKRARDVRNDFLGIFGVGPGIANMAVILIEKAYGVRFSDVDHRMMDIKPDVHTMRVLYRLGVAQTRSEVDALVAARQINPSYPGEIDGALWIIGRNWCVESHPSCRHCPLNTSCEKVID